MGQNLILRAFWMLVCLPIPCRCQADVVCFSLKRKTQQDIFHPDLDSLVGVDSVSVESPEPDVAG